MAFSSDLLSVPKEFIDLFKAGKEAARRGENHKAHQLFRRAIELDPYHEQVWLWLASVVETDEDRRVCFENVLEINPTNPTARQQLQRLEQKALAGVLNAERQQQKRRQGRRRVLGLALLVLLLVLSVAGAYAAGLI